MPHTTKHTTTALVTGGAQGIGKAVARRLLRDGWAVVIADSDPEAGMETWREYRRLGRLQFLPVDVSDESSVRKCVRQSIRFLRRLDGLVNNAGIGGPYSHPLEKASLDQWNHILGVNLTGAFLMAKHSVRHLRKARGAIVNISSTRALQSQPHTEAYAASKGGLVALTHSLALSLGPAIRVNCVSPGWIDTTGWRKRRDRKQAVLSRADHLQHPVGRVGEPDDIAGMVAYLLSASAGFVTGQNLVVDGGMTKKMIYVE